MAANMMVPFLRLTGEKQPASLLFTCLELPQEIGSWKLPIELYHPMLILNLYARVVGEYCLAWAGIIPGVL